GRDHEKTASHAYSLYCGRTPLTFVFVQVGYAIPAGLCFLISCRPQITGRGLRDGNLVELRHAAVSVCTCLVCRLCGCFSAETLPWRRVADLHVMMATALGAMLGWTLYKDGVTHIFHQEEGREFCGLLLTVVWLLLCRRSGRSGVGGLRLCTAAGITMFPVVAWTYYHVNKELRAEWPSHCTTAL
uniref:Transmembrane protein 220 n=1 Tax=Electrophorus electricus TaxID=8005 RepID=A0A4W4GW48_ELEEL